MNWIKEIKWYIKRLLKRTCKFCFYFEDGHHCMFPCGLGVTGHITNSTSYCCEFINLKDRGKELGMTSSLEVSGDQGLG